MSRIQRRLAPTAAGPGLVERACASSNCMPFGQVGMRNTMVNHAALPASVTHDAVRSQPLPNGIQSTKRTPRSTSAGQQAVAPNAAVSLIDTVHFLVASIPC